MLCTVAHFTQNHVCRILFIKAVARYTVCASSSYYIANHLPLKQQSFTHKALAQRLLAAVNFLIKAHEVSKRILAV